MFRMLSAFLVGFSVAAAINGNAAEALKPAARAKGPSLLLMQYNVQNLFDTQHDDGKIDWEFMPLSEPGKIAGCDADPRGTKSTISECKKVDWTDAKLKIKLGQIHKVVTAIGKPVAMMAVEEVENGNVVKTLAETLGFKRFEVTNSGDVRGIDVGLLFNESPDLKFVATRSHNPADFGFSKTTARHVLEVEFLAFAKQKLIILVTHLPSQSAPSIDRDDLMRIMVDKIIGDRMAKCADCHFVLTGDFNVIAADRPDPMVRIHNSKSLFDVDSLFRESASKLGVNLSEVPNGTYFYVRDMAWNLLDRFIVSKNMNDGQGLDIDLASYQIFAAPFMVGPFVYSYGYLKGSVVSGVPLRYEVKATSDLKAGYADHLPILIELNSL